MTILKANQEIRYVASAANENRKYSASAHLKVKIHCLKTAKKLRIV
jgi:hypothetical protein